MLHQPVMTDAASPLEPSGSIGSAPEHGASTTTIPSAACGPYDEPHVEKLPGWARLLVIVGGSAACWAAILHFAL